MGFTSIPPYGSVLTPTATALQTTAPGGANTTSKTTGTPIASTSKAVSGGVALFKALGDNMRLWMLAATLFGFGEWLL